MLPIKQGAKPASQDTSGYSFTQFGSSSHSLRFDEFDEFAPNKTKTERPRPLTMVE